jgi:hypothetical protein
LQSLVGSKFREHLLTHQITILGIISHSACLHTRILSFRWEGVPCESMVVEDLKILHSRSESWMSTREADNNAGNCRRYQSKIYKDV